jgi:hypothetical protein
VPGDKRLLGAATTDAEGRFVARVTAPPGYAHPNCAVMRAQVSATGFETVDGANILPAGGSADGTCQSGQGTLAVELRPL